MPLKSNLSVYFSRSPRLHYLTVALLIISTLTLVRIHTRPRPPEPLDTILKAYHPILLGRLVRQRLSIACEPRTPTSEEFSQYPFSEWPLSRFAAYYNIYHFLTTIWTPERLHRGGALVKPRVLDVGGSAFLKPFAERINVTQTRYPAVDIHSTPYASNSFDAVAADQVLEHVTLPHLAMLEMKRILKPGGYALITTVAYNPVHRAGIFHDFWRFMPDGLRMLSLPFEGGIKLCGSWGTGLAIATRAMYGMGSTAELQLHGKSKKEQLAENEEANAFLVWIVVQK